MKEILAEQKRVSVQKKQLSWGKKQGII